jgi:hypothetical protein
MTTHKVNKIQRSKSYFLRAAQPGRVGKRLGGKREARKSQKGFNRISFSLTVSYVPAPFHWSYSRISGKNNGRGVKRHRLST